MDLWTPPSYTQSWIWMKYKVLCACALYFLNASSGMPFSTFSHQSLSPNLQCFYQVLWNIGTQDIPVTFSKAVCLSGQNVKSLLTALVIAYLQFVEKQPGMLSIKTPTRKISSIKKKKKGWDNFLRTTISKEKHFKHRG